MTDPVTEMCDLIRQRAAAEPPQLFQFGGHLECMTCHQRADLGDPMQRLHGLGWPMCCGHTMRWLSRFELENEGLTAPDKDRA